MRLVLSKDNTAGPLTRIKAHQVPNNVLRFSQAIQSGNRLKKKNFVMIRLKKSSVHV